MLWLRALFAGSFAFFLGTAGHVMADGLLPGTAFLVVLYRVHGPAQRCRCSSGPPPGCGCSALLVGGQTFIHLCLTLDRRPRR